MEAETKQILEELKAIRLDMDFLKNRMKDVDLVMTDDDWDSIRNAESDLKKGEAKRLV
jgi:hypothetical protein